MSPSVCERADTQIHLSAKALKTAFWLLRCLIRPPAAWSVLGGGGGGINSSVSTMRESSSQKVTGTKLLHPWLSWWESRIMHKWPSVYWFRILSVDYVLGSAASAVPPSHPHKPFPPDSLHASSWIGIPTTNLQSCELGERCHHFILGEAHKSSVFSEWQSYFCAS